MLSELPVGKQKAEGHTKPNPGNALRAAVARNVK